MDCYKIVCPEEIGKLMPKSQLKPLVYRAKNADEDVAQMFVDQLEKDIYNIYQIFGKQKKMIFTRYDMAEFKESTHCWICNGLLGEDKVRDHCHFTGKFRGAAHGSCNLKFKKPKFTPFFFHNLCGYDSHLLVAKLGKSEGDITCIPHNEEKYISFSKKIQVGTYLDKDKNEKDIIHEIRFLDSAKFMASSLDSLVKNLGKDKLHHVRREFDGKTDFILRKGVYPYDCMDCFDKFSETKLLPKEKFYNRLNETHISDEDYDHARNVWKKFNLKDMGEYHDLYLKSDVLLLADVFEEFRNVCLENYQLDPAWYYTSPGLAWDAALKKTEVKLQLLTDPDMLLMFEGIRGGVSMITKRHGKANNPYMGEEFDPDSPTKYLAYLDANNLYGWAMCNHLLVGNFEWMSDSELKNWKNHSCILEVDLEYPVDLHDFHNDYTLASERLNIGGVEKLIPNLWKKSKYIICHKTLKLYQSLGLKIMRIHRGIKFDESAWLKPYITLNTDLRTNAKNDSEKDFFKLMNNSVFPKTMENIRNRVDIRLVNDRRKAEKLSAKPNFKHLTIFDEDLVSIHMKRTKLKFNKPVYCEMAILDLSKTLMYDFHYNYIKPKFGENAKLLFTDTDSLCYEIQTDDFFKDISQDVEQKFDTGNYPKDHKSEIPTGKNKKSNRDDER